MKKPSIVDNLQQIHPEFNFHVVYLSQHHKLAQQELALIME